tara:strand:+ start:449 stop:646 length:198 start_codon:yes stop_codon:yes gene_type:complete
LNGTAGDPDQLCCVVHRWFHRRIFALMQSTTDTNPNAMNDNSETDRNGEQEPVRKRLAQEVEVQH